MPLTPMYRVRTVWTGLAGGPFLTTTYHAAGGAAAQAAVDVADDMFDGARAHLASTLNYACEGIVDEVDPVTGSIVGQHSVTPFASNGISSSEVLSLGTQYQVNTVTGVFAGGRQIRGKVYFPGPTVSNNSGGQPTGSLVTNAVAAVGTAAAASICPLVVYSRTHGRWEQINAASGATYWARLRSRQR